MKKWTFLPQVAETNTPRPMDGAGEGSLYDEFIADILASIDPDIGMLKIAYFFGGTRWKSLYKRKLNVQMVYVDALYMY
jgi:hypothetical protein